MIYVAPLECAMTRIDIRHRKCIAEPFAPCQPFPTHP